MDASVQVSLSVGDEHEQRDFQDEELQIEDGDTDADKEAEATARLLHFAIDEEMDCSSDSDSNSDSERDSGSDVISDQHAVWLEFIPDKLVYQNDSEVVIINETCYNLCILRLIDMTSCLIL